MEISVEYQKRLNEDLPEWQEINNTNPECIKEICKLYSEKDGLKKSKQECSATNNSNFERYNVFLSAKRAILDDLIDLIKNQRRNESPETPTRHF